MTELEKKQTGAIYDACDSELREQQSRAKNLMRQYNDIPAENTMERTRILRTLFGTLGEHARVNQPIYVDYGYNIHLGANSLINMHCTLLDTGPIEIGVCTMIGPDVKIYTATHVYRDACTGRGRALLVCAGWQCDGPDKDNAGTHWQLYLDRRRQHHPARCHHWR